MRITTARRPRPSTAHIACLTRKTEGRPYFSMVTTAEAEYTMTMLRLMSSNVAVNSHLSDFSFLAIFVYFAPHPRRLRRHGLTAVPLQLNASSPETLPGRRITIV